MILIEFIFVNEMHRGVIVGEVVRHRLDFVFDLSLVRTFLRNHENFTRVLLAGGKFRIRTAADSFESSIHRDRVLLCVLHTFNTANGIGMALRNALAPERVSLAIRENGIRIDTVQREKTRIPTHGNHRNLTGSLGSGIHGGKMLRNRRMRVKGINHIEELCIFRSLLRQVRCTTTAKNHHIDLILPGRSFINAQHRNACGLNFHRRRITTCEHSHKFHVRSVLHSAFHATTEITITDNADFCHIGILYWG